MPRRKKESLPAIKQDGKYAVVYLNGRKIRLGRYGTDEAQQEYRRIIAEWLAVGDVTDSHKKESSYCIDDLATAFLKWAERVCGPSDYGNYKTALTMTLSDYSGTLVKDFGTRALKTMQCRFVEKGYARNYCNKLTRFIKRVFLWGVEWEFVTPEVAGALKLVSSVHRKEAPNRPGREDVPDEVVKMTLPYLLPTIRDMVIVQRLATMRPGEICGMKVKEIDLSDGKTWVYRPTEHKNKWRNHTRDIKLGKPEQAILERRMVGKSPDDYVFSPAEGMREKCELGAAKRKSKVQPSQKARKEERAANPKRMYNRCYTSMSYGKSIKKSIAAANAKLSNGEKIPHWTPYQLRHTAITELVKTDGVDVARATAGQKSINVTLGYNHADDDIATQAALKRHNIFE